MKNYYEILGVSEDSTQEDIKKAYRNLSKQYHPDVNPTGEDKFKEISEAYEHIGDETKRTNYDNMRKNPFGNSAHGFDVHSMFEQMMNMGGQRQAKAPDKVLQVVLNPVESYFGIKKDIVFESFEMCKPCSGSGGEKRTCNICKGTGVIIQILGTGLFRQQIQMPCNSCGGNGSVIIVACTTCNGKGVNNEHQKLNVSIPKNVDDGDFMRLRGKGDYHTNIRTKGDMILKVTMNNEGNFEKVGLDLIYKKKIDVFEFFSSDNISIEHPEGDLIIKLPESVDTEKPLRIPNKGYITENQRGNFYIKLSIKKDNESRIKVSEMLK